MNFIFPKNNCQLCSRLKEFRDSNKSINKKFYDLDIDWINNIKVNLSAIERRTLSLTKRRSVKKEFQVAWLLKSITLIDLTTLSGDDTYGKVDRLCQKALNPISSNILNALDLHKANIKKRGYRNDNPFYITSLFIL